jgi:hypothetical protein
MKTKENNVSNVAMLYRLKISKWGASQKDNNESHKVCLQNNAKDGAANVFIQLVPKEELKDIQRAANKVRAIWMRYTLVWLEEGIRILPARSYDKFTAEIKLAVDEFDLEVKNFIARYPEIVKNASPILGELLKNNPLPSVEELKYKFTIRQDVLPIPKPSDFQISSIGDEPLNEIRKNIANAVINATEDAVKKLYDELYNLVSKIKDTTNVKDKIFRDSLIGNLKDFCERLPDLNIINDENLNNLCKDCVKQFAKINPQELRDDENLRKETSLKAETFLNNIRKIDLDME